MVRKTEAESWFSLFVIHSMGLVWRGTDGSVLLAGWYTLIVESACGIHVRLLR